MNALQLKIVTNKEKLSLNECQVMLNPVCHLINGRQKVKINISRDMGLSHRDSLLLFLTLKEQ